jgi:hypothetical protein
MNLLHRSFDRGAAALAALLALSAAPGPAGAQTQRLSDDVFSPLALKAETALRERIGRPMRVEFHRAQGFRFGKAQDAVSLVSFDWTPQGGGDTHCVVNIFHGTRLSSIDALEPDTSVPWSCDGEPSLKFADVDGDSCIDVVALFPYRPPSREHFLLPLVLACTEAGRAHGVDAARTVWLRSQGKKKAPVRSLAEAMRALAAFNALPAR